MVYERSFRIEQRFQTAINLIKSGKVNARGLAAALNVSVPTTQRIIAELKRRGYEIRSVREKWGWQYELVNSPSSQAQRI